MSCVHLQSKLIVLFLFALTRCSQGLVPAQLQKEPSTVQPTLVDSSSSNVSWQEVEIPPPAHLQHREKRGTDEFQSTIPVGERLKSGESVLLLENLASEWECQELMKLVCQTHIYSDRGKEEIPMDKPGLTRIPTIPAFLRAAKTKTPCVTSLCDDADDICQRILRRAFRCIDREQSSVSEILFGGRSDLEEMFLQDQLHWSSREPAVNIYTDGGEFLAHKDAQSLTILLALTCPNASFEGGGTAFWSQDARGHRIEEPSLTLRPKTGTAILFGGCVTHAGVAISSGIRGVLVASCSHKKERSNQVEQRDIYGDSM